MGVSDETCKLVLAGLSGKRAVVLDADAITSFSGNPERLREALHRRRDHATILTPHEGEFSRYFGALEARTEVGSKLERARLAAQAVEAVVLLKRCV